MKVNINQLCEVELTEEGILHLKKKMSYIMKTSWYNDGVLTTELWNLMNIFGDKMCMSDEQMFKENNIKIILDK
jgi:hypothetical protein